MFVQEIDRKIGAARGTRWNLGTDPLYISAYAFAHWGGTFYLFITSGGATTVRTIDRKSATTRPCSTTCPGSATP